tara:strand:+ start:1636 stop:1803 length:168 start_codon:yes stop_codon:yes gene_type:complete
MTDKYKSVAIKEPYYNVLVSIANSLQRGPGQQMMYLIKKEADNKGYKIKERKVKK